MHKKSDIAFCAGVLVAAAALSAPGWAATDGQLMELTVNVTRQMAGMPALPAHTTSRQICTKDGSFDRHTLGANILIKRVWALEEALHSVTSN